MESLTFLASTAKSKVQPLYVVHGDEDFLKRQVLHKLRSVVLGDGPDDFAVSSYDGDNAEYADVMDELQTVPFFGARRLIIINGADPFVTEHRKKLERSMEQLPASATLVLVVKTWAATTNLAKMIDAKATIACKAPSSQKLVGWCVEWAKSRHDKQLTRPAAQLLVDLIGAEMGQLDQELEKLTIYVGSRARIAEEDVDKLVGRSQAQNTWKIFDAIGQGKTKDALAILHGSLEQGEDPIRIMGAFSLQLRRLAQAGQLAVQGMPLGAALAEVGVPHYFIQGCQQQLRHLGRGRAAQLYDWLIEINLDLRGNSPLPPRILLERLVIRLAQKN